MINLLKTVDTALIKKSVQPTAPNSKYHVLDIVYAVVYVSNLPNRQLFSSVLLARHPVCHPR